jgi:Glutaredoxin-like domain (DUF836)
VSARVILYTRPGCGLCDEARAVIAAVRDRLTSRAGDVGAPPFSVEEVDISGDDALELRYGIRIPVVEVDGEELFELTVDADALAEVVGG